MRESHPPPKPRNHSKPLKGLAIPFKGLRLLPDSPLYASFALVTCSEVILGLICARSRGAFIFAVLPPILG